MAFRKDPVAAHFRVPMRYRISTWVSLLCLAIAVAGLAIGLIANGRTSSEAKHRTQQLQDVICGVYVPLGNAYLPEHSSALARTIVAATRHGAVSIHCPGVK